MKIFLSLVIGYLLGSLNPAALFSKLKNINLRKQGTGNLGATNVMLVFGKRYAVVVMLFDIIKSALAVKLAQKFFPTLNVSGLLAGSAAVVGHIYPFYMKFKGGKGLASFGGMILALDPLLFGILLPIALTMMLIVNYSFVMPISAALLFPVFYGIRSGSAAAFMISAALSLLIICKHLGNLRKAIRGEDVKIREYITTHLFH